MTESGPTMGYCVWYDRIRGPIEARGSHNCHIGPNILSRMDVRYCKLGDKIHSIAQADAPRHLHGTRCMNQ